MIEPTVRQGHNPLPVREHWLIKANLYNYRLHLLKEIPQCILASKILQAKFMLCGEDLDVLRASTSSSSSNQHSNNVLFRQEQSPSVVITKMLAILDNLAPYLLDRTTDIITGGPKYTSDMPHEPEVHRNEMWYVSEDEDRNFKSLQLGHGDGNEAGGNTPSSTNSYAPVSYTHLTLPTTPYV